MYSKLYTQQVCIVPAILVHWHLLTTTNRLLNDATFIAHNELALPGVYLSRIAYWVLNTAGYCVVRTVSKKILCAYLCTWYRVLTTAY